jgi:ABC-type multidrug transport system permease subunit
MYRPSAISAANLLADLPFSAVRVLVFNIIVYFMSNLHRSPGGFFTFHVFNYIAYLAMQGFFRTFGLLCQSFESAFRLSVFFIPNMASQVRTPLFTFPHLHHQIQYSGYMIPLGSMKRWLFWIYYIK